jgi:Spy/CpxP family protein refolding chaperone
MKKLLMIVWLMIMGCASVYCQSRMTDEEKEEIVARYQAYMDELNLTEEQKPKVEEINTAYFQGLSDMKNTDASRLEKYKTFKALSTKRDDEMKKVLTKEQYTVYKENQQEQRKNLKERRRNNR